MDLNVGKELAALRRMPSRPAIAVRRSVRHNDEQDRENLRYG